jgi:hypothetical protein
MHDIIITPEGTSKLLKNLNPTKAIGPDKISPHDIGLVSVVSQHRHRTH